MEEILIQLIKESNLHKEIYDKLGISQEKISVFDEIIELANKVNSQLSENENVDANYNRLYTDQANRILSIMQFRGQADSNFVNHQNEHWKTQNFQQFDNHLYINFCSHVKSLLFQVNFFEKIGNFNSNIVLVGANGSGKTSISEKLKEYLNNNGVFISAQRILLLPLFETVSNPVVTASKLKKEQTRTKTYKDQDQFRYISSEFEIVLKHLLAENIAVGNSYRKEAFEKVKNGNKIDEPKKTNLDLAFEIWNSLIEHRYLDCEDGINIKTFIKGEATSYPSIQMSDGEKVLLYLISQILLAPQNGFIVIDEPEMYLHKTILKKLWDELESRRSDCLFIYLTHDLDFATSRNTAKKIWIKSYTYPDFWEMEQIQTNEIPEALLLEVLGSRKIYFFVKELKAL
jgi:ABC-type dipeptide/oligopeptide/nickel transport system ATPase component